MRIHLFVFHLSPVHFFMRIQTEFRRHGRAVFAANISQELSTFQLMGIICCGFVTSKFYLTHRMKPG